MARRNNGHEEHEAYLAQGAQEREETIKKAKEEMSSAEDSILETEIRDMWWEQGEAVMKEMCEDDDD